MLRTPLPVHEPTNHDPYRGIDSPRAIRAVLRDAEPEAAPFLRARLLVAEEYRKLGNIVGQLMSPRARALMSIWGNLCGDPGRFAVAEHAADALARVKAILAADVAEHVEPCACGAPKHPRRRLCDKCRDRRRREAGRERTRQHRTRGGTV